MNTEDDRESAGLRPAIGLPPPMDPLEAEIAAAGQEMFGSDSESPGVAPPAAEEAPSKETGDAVEQIEDPDLIQEGKAMDAELAGEPKPLPPPPPVPPEEPWALIKHGLRENETRPPPPSPISEKMKAVGWEPSPKTAEKAGPADWAQLQKDLQDAERSAESTRTINAGLHAVAPGFTGPANAGQGEIDAAKAAIEGHERLLSESRQQDADAELKKKSALDQERERQQIDLAKTAADTAARAKLVSDAKDQARRDPTSTESKQAREALRPVFAMLGEVPADFDSWTAETVERHAKSLTPVATGAASRKKTEAELSAKEKAAAEESTSLEGEKAGLSADKRVLKLGYTPEMIAKLDRHGVDKIRDELGHLGKAAGAGTGAPEKPIRTIEDIPSPADRAKVQALINGGVGITETLSRKDKDRVMGMLLQVKPDYDSSKHGTYAAIAKQIAEDPSIHSALTAKEHFKRAMENIPDNVDANFVNHIANALQKGTGGTGLSKFEADVAVGAGELSKGLGENAEAGKEAVKRLLEPGQSKGQIRDHLMELIYLQDEGVEMKRKKFESAAPKGTALPDILKREAPAAGIQTRKTKSGGDAFSKDGKRWFTSREEAEAN